MTLTIPFSEACERNKDVILDVLSPYLQTLDSVLEIGSGTAQHALHFARANPHLQWQTSDQRSYIEGIVAQLENAAVENVLPPFELDVNQAQWIANEQRYPAVYTANTFHIMTWLDVQAFFKGLPDATTANALLCVYGPFKYQGNFTSASNQTFDQTLRSRECGSAIRDFEAVNDLASSAGFELVSDTAMPANNQCLIWQRSQ